MKRATAGGPRGVAIVALACCLGLPPAAAGQGAEADLEAIASAISRGQFAAAERALRRLPQRGPRGDYLLGFSLIQLFRFEEAEAALRRATESRPGNHVWLHALAKSLIEQRKNLAAIEVLDRALALEPDPDYHFAKAMCALNTGDLETAEAELRACLAGDPEHGEALYKLGRILVDRGEYGAALVPLRASLEVAPGNLEARFLLGLAAGRDGDPETARRAFETVLERVPGHTGAVYNLGRVLIQLGRRDEGLARLERFRALSPLQDRIDHLERAAQKNPRNLDLRLELARLLLEVGKGQEALDNLLAARQLDPGSAAAYRLLADAFRRLGQPDNAVRAEAFARRLESDE